MSALGVIGDYTVRRIRGSIAVQSALGVEDNAAQELTYGILVADVDAVAGAALPESDEDPADWMAYGVVFTSAMGSFSAGVHPLEVVEIDNKAMRKVNENHQQLVMILDSHPANAGNLVVQTAGRFLVSHGRR